MTMTVIFKPVKLCKRENLYNSHLDNGEYCSSAFPQHVRYSQLHRVGEQGLYKS